MSHVALLSDYWPPVWPCSDLCSIMVACDMHWNWHIHVLVRLCMLCRVLKASAPSSTAACGTSTGTGFAGTRSRPGMLACSHALTMAVFRTLL